MKFTFQGNLMQGYIDLDNSPVQLCESHRDLGIVLDKHINFHEHIAKKTKICNKLIGTIKHLSFHLPRKSLLTICSTSS